jgi:hypothetical protein
MKKILSLLVLSVLLVSLFSCGGSEKKAEAYLGLGHEIVHDDGGNMPYMYLYAAAVIVDGANSTVISVALDVYMARAEIGENGVVTEGSAEFVNSAAGMGSAEFNMIFSEVATAVAGKTASEIEALITDNTMQEIAAMCKAIAYAVKTAKSACGKTDKPGVALAGNLTATSADFIAGTNGSIKATVDFMAVALDADNKVTGAALDTAQDLTREFDPTGALVDPAADFKTKREKKYVYGMKPASGIKLEWFEQAENFCEYLRGKTSTEIGSIGVANGYPTEDALLSGCTMGISGYITVAVAAVAAAN